LSILPLSFPLRPEARHFPIRWRNHQERQKERRHADGQQVSPAFLSPRERRDEYYARDE
jgi:hypothetical protein